LISRANGKFWKLYQALPPDIKKQAKESFILFKKDPWYPSLHFKRVHSSLPVYSARINIDYRAVGIPSRFLIFSFFYLSRFFVSWRLCVMLLFFLLCRRRNDPSGYFYCGF
jgi:hypothetical protein